MPRDYYAILGVAPTSEDVVIRAAYRALMRRYHPDADPSSDASKRAQAINDAYAVLGDPEKRARYDGSLAAHGLIRPDPVRHRGARVLPRPGPAAAIGLAALAAAMLAIAVWPPIAQLPLPSLPISGDQRDSPSLPEEEASTAGIAVTTTSSACDDRSASGLIKEELFRRAAQLRPADSAEFARVASQAIVRMEAPTSRDAGCRAFLAVDLPPGLVVEGGRRNLNAEVGYGLDQKEGRKTRLARLTGVNGLVRSLATLAPPPPVEPVVEAIEPVQVASAERVPAAPRPAKLPSKVDEQKLAMASTKKETSPKSAEPTAQPSFNCRIASGSAEKAICDSNNLAALDRQAALLYNQSWGKANEAKRTALLQTRAEFVERRNKCGSESCLTSSYLARMREISDIMAGRRQQ